MQLLDSWTPSCSKQSSILAEKTQKIPARQLLTQSQAQTPTLWLLVTDSILIFEHVIPFVLRYMSIPYWPACPLSCLLWPWVTLSCHCLSSSNFGHILSVSSLWLVHVGSVSPMKVWEIRFRLKAFTSFHLNSPMSAHTGTWWHRKNTNSHGILTLYFHISVLGSEDVDKLWTILSLPSSPMGIRTKTMSLWLLHNSHL